MNNSTQVTTMLARWRGGDDNALNDLYPVIEKELKRIARRHIRQLRPGNTMQTTAVINEAYVRLAAQRGFELQNRSHFFAIASTMMRRVLLNYIRDAKRQKRGDGATRVSYDETRLFTDATSDELQKLDDALVVLGKVDPRKRRVVELRYFGGLTVEETAEVLDLAAITVMRDWRLAKGWLAHELGNGQ